MVILIFMSHYEDFIILVVQGLLKSLLCAIKIVVAAQVSGKIIEKMMDLIIRYAEYFV